MPIPPQMPIMQKDRGDRVYFSAADRALQAFLPEGTGAFDRSLILHVLFQPGGLLLPDIFCFFDCVDQHLARPDRSLLEACIANGVIAIAVRDPNASSFQEILTIVQGSGDPSRRIRGVSRNAARIATRLDLDKDGAGFTRITWPQDVGGKFEIALKTCLQQNDAPDFYGDIQATEALAKVWTQTERWRWDAIDEAAKRTRNLGARGLRRGILWNVVGESLGMQQAHEVEGPEELLRLANHKNVGQIVAFCKWVTWCYQVNGALQFGAQPSMPGWDWRSLPVVQPLLRAGTDDSVAEQTKTIAAKLPPLDDLRLMAPNELIALREDKGRGFFEACENWFSTPTDDLAGILEEQLNTYCKAICERANPRSLSDLVVDAVAGGRTAWKRALGASGKLGIGLAGALLWKGTPLLLAGAGAGYLVYRGLRHRRRAVDLLVRRPKHCAGGLEVVLPHDRNL